MPSVANPSFDVDLSSWSKTDADASVTLTRDTAVFNSAPGAAKMVNTAAGGDDFIEQFVNTGVGVFQVRAWVNCTVFTSGALSNRGLWIQTASSNFVTYESQLTAATSGWTQLTVGGILVQPNDFRLDVRLYAPQGTLYWDDISVEEVGHPNRNPVPFQAQGRNL